MLTSLITRTALLSRRMTAMTQATFRSNKENTYLWWSVLNISFQRSCWVVQYLQYLHYPCLIPWLRWETWNFCDWNRCIEWSFCVSLASFPNTTERLSYADSLQVNDKIDRDFFPRRHGEIRRRGDGNRKRDISFETSLRMYKRLWPDVAQSSLPEAAILLVSGRGSRPLAKSKGSRYFQRMTRGTPGD